LGEKSAHSNHEAPKDQGRRQAPAYELIDHTADIGFRVEAATLEDLFARAALALHDIMADSSAARPAVERVLSIEGAAGAETDLEDLFVRFVEEALWAFEGDRFIFAEVTVERVAGGRVTGRARGEPFDRARHELRRPVKAVTYHDVAVTRTPAGWTAQVILDL
jgi:SHS2 domain-containing protein